MSEQNLLEQRGPYGYTPCYTCKGTGYFEYSNTSTWHGGMGGCAMTTDVCDKCWGSGMDEFPWPSHREFAEMEARLEAMQDQS